jgi:hypothetical protein
MKNPALRITGRTFDIVVTSNTCGLESVYPQYGCAEYGAKVSPEKKAGSDQYFLPVFLAGFSVS